MHVSDKVAIDLQHNNFIIRKREGKLSGSRPAAIFTTLITENPIKNDLKKKNQKKLNRTLYSQCTIQNSVPDMRFFMIIKYFRSPTKCLKV